MTKTAGKLFVVATPIGNLDDMSSRAREILAGVDLVVAEDTRHSGRLLATLGIQTDMTSLHEHNEREKAQTLIDKLRSGQDLALISDAGTPLISDPGYHLVRQARATGLEVVPVPGPSALIAALSVSGLPANEFYFSGFLPAKPGLRKKRLEALLDSEVTVVFYESCHRIEETLQDIARLANPERKISLARELTKMYEECYTGKVGEVVNWLSPDRVRGEFVVMLEGRSVQRNEEIHVPVETLLQELLKELPVSRAAAVAARLSGEERQTLYKQAERIKQDAWTG